MPAKSPSIAGRALLGFLVGSVFGPGSAEIRLGFGLVGAVIGGATAFSALHDRRSSVNAIESFLREAFADGDLDTETLERLRRRVGTAEAATAAAVWNEPRNAASAAPIAPPPVTPAPAVPATPPAAPMVQPPPVAPVAPGRPRRKLGDILPPWRAVASFCRSLRGDFGVQGLGSLGVLLVFTATLGFVVFAFSEVGATFRPVAELTVPLVLFCMSAFLRRRRAPFMAAALEGLGGAVAPVMAFAAFSDGAPVPPDVERAALVAVLASCALVLAGIYAVVAVRRPTTPLRVLVAPLVWVAVAIVGLAIHEETSAAMFALVIVAVAVTGWLVAARHGVLAAAARTALLPGLGAGYALLLLFGYAEGWPSWPMVVGGVGALAALESRRIAGAGIWLTEAALVAVTGMTASVEVGADWAGCAVVGAAVLLGERWVAAADGRLATVVYGSLGTAGLVAAAATPEPLLIAAVALAVWGHGRRLVPAAGFGALPAVVAAVAPALALIAVGRLSEAKVGLLAAAIVVAVNVGVTRLWRRRDIYLAWGTMAYAAGVGVAAAVTASAGAGIPFVTALGIASAAVAFAPGPSGLRVWLAAALGVGSWVGLVELTAWSVPAAVLGLATAGLALVVAAVWTPGRAGGHLGLAGHVMGLMGLPLVADTMRIAVVAAWLAGWLLEVVYERKRAPLQRLVGAREVLDVSWLATAPLLLGLPIEAMLIVEEARPSAGLAGVALVLAATSLAYGAIAGLPSWRPALSREALVAGVAASALGVAVAAAFDPLVASDRALQATVLGAGISGVAACWRRVTLVMHWYAWALAAPLALLAGLAAAVGVADLHWVAIGWGATVSLGALLADGLIAGRRQPDRVLVSWLVPPAVLGSLAAVAGIVVGLDDVFARWWPVTAAAAVWTGLVAWLMRNASLTVLSWSAASVSYASLVTGAGVVLADEPAYLTWSTLVLLAIATAAPRTTSFVGRFDLPPLGVGLVTGGCAVALGAAGGTTALTWAPIGAALIVVAAVRRRWWFLAPCGSILLIASAFDAGAWWPAAALTLHTVATAALARLGSGTAAAALQTTSAALGVGSWWSLLTALHADRDHVVMATAVLCAAVAAAGAAFVVRNPDPAHHARWTAPWAVAALAGLVAVAAWAAVSGVDPGPRWVVTAAVGVWMFAVAVAASALDATVLRVVTTGLLLSWVAAWGWAAVLDLEGWALWASAAAAALTTTAAVAANAALYSGWRPYVLSTMVVLHGAAVALALAALPDRRLLVYTLLAAAAASVVADLLYGLRGARYLAPGLAFGSWLAFVRGASAGDIQWYVPPFAVASLVDLEMGRRWRRLRGRVPLSTPEMVATEVLALSLAIGPSLVQVATVDVRYGLLAVVWGTVAAVWGAATRVRRRLLIGIAGAGLGALLMVAVPLAELLPEFRGPALWATVFVMGAILIAVAATLEQARRRIAELRTTFAGITSGWE